MGTFLNWFIGWKGEFYGELDGKIWKKDELAKIRYRIKKEEYMKTLESKSWNEYRDEEGIQEEME